MLHRGSRTIKVRKDELIAKIHENKENHIQEYKEAVVAYKKEALRQLEELKDRVNDGDLNIKLKLTVPINNEENYDKIVEMFTWEVEDYVELSQDEFREYVQDDTDFARQAKMSNSYYIG